MVQTDIFT